MPISFKKYVEKTELINKKENIVNIPNLENRINKIFNNSEDPTDIFIKIFKIIYPNWNNIKSIKGFTHISESLNIKIINKFRELDLKNNPNIEYLNTSGSVFLWFNKGFSDNKNLSNNQVEICECVLNG